MNFPFIGQRCQAISFHYHRTRIERSSGISLNRNSYRSFPRLVLLISLLLAALGLADKSVAEKSVANKPKLQLATVYHAGLDIHHYWVSEKLDGVRGYWDGRQLLTRQGYPIDAPDWFTEALPEQPLDGELWMARGQFDALSGLVRRSHIEGQPDALDDWRRVKFMLFDLPQFPGTFSQRLAQLHDLVGKVDRQWIQVIEQRRVVSDSALMTWLDTLVAEGGEGLMLHHEDALYHQGRSHQLLKLKLWQDAEAKVIGHQPGKGKYVGMLGALLVETPTGVRFKLGSGFSDLQRQHPPKIGSIVTYKYTGVSAKGVPRFASFMRLRQP
ncbi:DNA ligase [Amphritea sp. 1_MG-2023]|uniref:DNA ligase n=1 Tax=Amphritea sp. 1_MG-2023 TaxID=3062670 RepID=UPI0026E3319B|nr:DNA ligase [Amphritea sp. 1_MG-2023]MDO6564459.1 DNA ligase [Amphritea sp. 1_MG-2023]